MTDVQILMSSGVCMDRGKALEVSYIRHRCHFEFKEFYQEYYRFVARFLFFLTICLMRVTQHFRQYLKDFALANKVHGSLRTLLFHHRFIAICFKIIANDREIRRAISEETCRPMAT